jgi:hypothetical protein
MTIETLPDYTGDGNAHTIASLATALDPTRYPATTNWSRRWFQISFISGTGTGRLGGAEIGASRGIPLGTSGYFQTPPIAGLSELYSLDTTYILIPATMVVSIALL